MRPLAILLLAGVLSVRADEPRFISLTPAQPWGEIVVWSNSVPTGYCHLQYTWDLSAPWYFLWINFPVTNAVMTQDTWPRFLSDVRNAVGDFSSGRIDFSRMFYRVVSTTNLLDFPPTYGTNAVRVTNLSEGGISNLVLAVDCFCCAPQSIGSVPQGVTTGDFSFVTWNPIIWDFDNGPYDNPCLFLEIDYDLAGQHHEGWQPLQHFTLPGEVMWITVSNSTTVLRMAPNKMPGHIP